MCNAPVGLGANRTLTLSLFCIIDIPPHKFFSFLLSGYTLVGSLAAAYGQYNLNAQRTIVFGQDLPASVSLTKILNMGAHRF
jgi:hypothetical protein